MTLFALTKPECGVFQKVLDKFFDGKMDQKTIDATLAIFLPLALS